MQFSTAVRIHNVLHPKTLPNGSQDDGEYLIVDLSKLPATPMSQTIEITVTAKQPTDPIQPGGSNPPSNPAVPPVTPPSAATAPLAATGVPELVWALATAALLLLGLGVSMTVVARQRA
ncbi:hypothetical protein [Renibacterium salmoninarum]|uniref:Hypothetical membrane protein n=1 Tax=Renibacterium salmoninarum TaxID=1646 RepID=A5HB63_RENSA|nr:hypothetical protein [Renibacterium salmoninarum]ABQ01452.1 hypothetical membrane protein [Renibacterium salmoninarum]